MQEALEGLEPVRVWFYFGLLSAMDRRSGHEGDAYRLVTTLATDKGLSYDEDPLNWVLVRIPATSGMEDRPGICFQAHLDGVPAGPVDYDWSQGVKIIRDGNVLRADGTSLMADNAIGVAIMLYLMEAEGIEHGPIELLFTCREETGLEGVMNLPEGILQSKYLINLDNEDMGEICIGCAGGKYCDINFPVHGNQLQTFEVHLHGLPGAHSGMDIHKQHGSALLILAHLAAHLTEPIATASALLVSLDAGGVRNKIPADGRAKFVTTHSRENIDLAIRQFMESELKMLPDSENAKIVFDIAWEGNESAVSPTLPDFINVLPHGVISFDERLGIPRTSVNVASVGFSDDSAMLMLSLRSSMAVEMEMLQRRIVAACKLAGATATFDNKYPAWPPDFESPLVQQATEIYERVFHHAPKIGASHGGLEPGVICLKHRDTGLLAIAIGSTIRGPHSTIEEADIPSVGQLLNLVLALLTQLR